MGFSRVPCDAARLPRRGSPTHPSTVMQQKGRKLFWKLPSFLHLEPLVRKRLRLARTPVYFSRKYTVKQERACQTNGWKCSGACRCLSRCPRTSGNVSLRGAGCARLRAGRPCSVNGFVSNALGYKTFFIFTMFATIPAFLITYFVPFTYPDEKKK